MKKFLVCLAVLSVLVAAGLAGLSVLPHAHGSDIDHSQHSSCAVHQFSLGQTQAVSFSLFLWTVFFAFLWLVSPEIRFISSTPLCRASCRAPPAVF